MVADLTEDFAIFVVTKHVLNVQFNGKYINLNSSVSDYFKLKIYES